MKSFFSGSWKTTSAGIAMIAGAAIHIGFAIHSKTVTEADLTATVPVLLGGVGLLMARDNNKTSEDVGAAQPKQ